MKLILEVFFCCCMMAIILILTGDLAATPQEKADEGVSIYLLKDATIDIEAAEKIPLDQLELNDEPWIASKDIELYDVSCHCFLLSKDVTEMWAVRGGSPDQRVMLRGKPFVVTAAGERCYLGFLHAVYSSNSPNVNAPKIWNPNIIAGLNILSIGKYQGKRNALTGAVELQSRDVRNDPRVIAALKKQGQYHAGLQCTLDKVEVFKHDEASVIGYTYTLRNLDEDDMHVFDPAKMGDGLFHHFTNGVRITQQVDNEQQAILFATDREKSQIARSPDSFGQLEQDWLTLLKAGESLTRTVLNDGYEKMTPGAAQCRFRIHGPIMLSKEQSQWNGHRAWFGILEAELKTELVPVPLSSRPEVKARYNKLKEKTTGESRNIK